MYLQNHFGLGLSSMIVIMIDMILSVQGKHILRFAGLQTTTELDLLQKSTFKIFWLNLKEEEGFYA